MTLHDLDVTPDDVSATALGYRVDTAPAPESLVETVLDHPRLPAALRLSILGASHAVTLVVDGRDYVTEEVSCRASTSGGGLPGAGESRPGSWGRHRLTGSVRTWSPAAFDALVAELTSRAENTPEVLAGRFPGAEGALTVVAAEPDATGWQWETWHLYPTTAPDGTAVGGEVVSTVSSLEVSPVRVSMGVGA